MVTLAIKTKHINNRIARIISYFVWAIPPMIVAIAMLIFLKSNKFYPFGDITMSWGDMDQQTIPLLLDYKRILSGEEGFFFNTKTAGGMNFYGVFFFFISSPFAFLVAFVDETKVALFVNVLVMLKMCAISCAASVYFNVKHPKHPFLNVTLSVLYAYSGYTMYYYQNMMWLDVMCLFPLLLWGLDLLKKGNKWLFVGMLSACLFANFYLCYMIVVFLLLYAFVWLVISRDKKFAIDFVISCLLAAMLTAIVWLPSLVQYFSSGRKSSIIDGLKTSKIFASHQTTLPSIFSVLFLFPFAIAGRNAGDEEQNRDGKTRFVVFLLSLVPIVIEPINKMWQTGSYMSFPTRYAFIPIFLCLSLAMDGLTAEKAGDNSEENGADFIPKKETNFFKKSKKEAPRYALSAVLLGFSIWYFVFAVDYTRTNRTTMDQYAHSLWGNAASFEALLTLCSIAIAIGVLCFVLWRFNFFKPVLLWMTVAVLAFSELYVAPTVYMRGGAHSAERHLQIMELADKIEDDGYYRVKSEAEYSGYDFDANMMGSLGYNALGHFTSLTNGNYMTTMKQFGYTSYWMEVGNSGGTILSDALTSVKYTVQRGSQIDKNKINVYQGEAYGIYETPCYLPLGIISQADIIEEWQETGGQYPRAAFQQRLAEDFFNNPDIVKICDIENATLTNLTMEKDENGKYVLTPNGSQGQITFTLDLEGEHTLYFNAFDENSNALNQAINKKFAIKTSGYSLSEYPTQKRNGILCIGNRKGKQTLTATVKEKVTVQDISVLAIDNAALKEEVSKTKTVGLQAGKSSYAGSYTAEQDECVFLSVAYDEGMTLRVNGKKAKLYEVYDGFTAFYVKAGENDIEITYTPPGFALGAGISVIGAGLCAAICVLWIWKKRSLTLPKICDEIAYYGLLCVGVAVIALVYIIPLVICAL